MSARAIAARCFSPPERIGGQRVHAVAEADPAQELDHVGAIARFLLAEDAERQGDVLEGRQVVEQAEILEDDADAAAERRQVAASSGAAASRSKTVIRPRVGFSDRKKSRMSVVLPAPDGPVRNWNDFGAIWNDRSRRTSGSHAVAQADILEADQIPGPRLAEWIPARRRPGVSRSIVAS